MYKLKIGPENQFLEPTLNAFAMIKDFLQIIGLHKKDPIQIQGYQSYGTDTHLYAMGRALEEEGVDLDRSSFVSAFRNAYKQFKSDELAFAKLKLRLPDDRVFEIETDSEGYYKLDQNVEALSALTNTQGWLQLELSYADFGKRQVVLKNRFPSQMLIPSAQAEYGIISDIDDTILHTGVVSLLKWRVILNTLFRNVARRSPLKGAAELYQKLHLGKSGTAANPLFYVSNSPWNLYNYLEAFIKNNNFPKGSILLRNFRTPLDKSLVPEKPHKQREIRNILKTYPALSFILIGDSGEHDADIYIEIAQEYPEQIKAIYLRSVKSKKRILRISGLLDGYKTTPALLVKSSKEAEEHARGLGLII